MDAADNPIPLMPGILRSTMTLSGFEVTTPSTWDTFVLDPAVRLLGLQSAVSHPDVNLLVFEHDCGSSIPILSRRLRHLSRLNPSQATRLAATRESAKA